MKATPMMQQYLEVKERYPDAILFFRLGDFYEMFFEDAQVVSRELGLTLTARSKGANEVPMAGMPYHSSQPYIRDLVEKGFSVAICEQVEDAAVAQGIVKRDVVRVVSPGVLLDEESLDARTPNYLAAVAARGDGFGLAYVDITTGDFRATELTTADELSSELERIEAREVLVSSEDVDAVGPIVESLAGLFLRKRRPEGFEPDGLTRTLESGVRLSEELRGDGFFLGPGEVKAFFDEARSYGFHHPGLVSAAMAAVLSYVVETQRGVAAIVQRVQPYRARAFLVVDEATKANLELTRTLMGGKKKGSLLSIIDETKTALGGRRLRHWLNYPLIHPEAIGARHDAVEVLLREPVLRQDVTGCLDEVYDIERLCGRVASGRANARDLRSLQSTLAVIPELIGLLAGKDAALLVRLSGALDPLEELSAHIDEALVEEPPADLTEGGLFQKGFHPELDELLELSSSGKDWMLRFEAEEKERTGISSLKVKFNKVFGYFIEVTKANLDRVPEDYIRKQTLANAERYFVPELKEMEERILGASERRKILEYELFEELRGVVAQEMGRLLRTADALADLDVLAGLAELAARREYVRPEVDEGSRLSIVDGRHPVVETTLTDERFVPNSVALDTEEAHLLIITGPNMAGKSTVIRQVALITLLAQMGSFVPAKSARIGVVDKIFSRVGASDNLARGHSTFMVEMTETAHILNNATSRSLIILDEIGRGTATFDGLSIAWAVAEYLHDQIGARTMFATHYHELTELERTLDGLKNLSIAVKEWQEDIIFLRKLVEGQANRSYGIQVGRLAGLPPAVVDRARQVLANLEAGQFDEMGLPTPGAAPGRPPRVSQRHNPNQLQLFGGGGPGVSAEEREVLDAVRGSEVDALTPIEALNLVHQWWMMLQE